MLPQLPNPSLARLNKRADRIWEKALEKAHFSSLIGQNSQMARLKPIAAKGRAISLMDFIDSRLR